MRVLISLMVLVGCGGTAAKRDGAPVDGVPADAGARDAPADVASDLCAGKPCLTAIHDEADWAFVAGDFASGRCEIDQLSKYLAPATPDAELQETVYQDVKAYPFHLEFVREVLAEYFGGITRDAYYDMVLKRAQRQYWTGALFRIIDGSTTLGYAFDVYLDPVDPIEQVTRDEVIAIHDLLAETFSLPLGYAPWTDIAIENARAFDPLPFPLWLPVECPTEPCEDPGDNCLEVPPATDVCGVFLEGRSVEQEYAHKVRLHMEPGYYKLPKDDGGMPPKYTLFLSGEYGPAREALSPLGHGYWSVTPEPPNVRYAYSQLLTDGSNNVVFSWDFSLPASGGRIVAEEPWLSQQFWPHGLVNGGAVPDDHLRFASCTYEGLDLFHADGTLAGGDSFRLEYRHQLPVAGSGPLNIVAAQVTLDGATANVSDYFQLVYAGEHHNWNNQFWVIFDEPMTYSGHPVYGLWVDEAAFSCCPLDGAWTLDASLHALDELSVLDYQVEMQ